MKFEKFSKMTAVERTIAILQAMMSKPRKKLSVEEAAIIIQ
jgi:hypothetical protein